MEKSEKIISVPMTRRAVGQAAVNAQDAASKAFADRRWKEAGEQWNSAARFCFALDKTEE